LTVIGFPACTVSGILQGQREVGAVWPHKNGSGFDLVIVDQLNVSGRIVCTERKEKVVEPVEGPIEA
jgi:hypothetical protein